MKQNMLDATGNDQTGAVPVEKPITTGGPATKLDRSICKIVGTAINIADIAEENGDVR